MTNANDKPAKKAKKPNIIVRLLALLVTAALLLGALVLVVYRDRFNLDALKRYIAYRALETGETGQAAPFTHAGGDKASFAYLDTGVVMCSASGARYYSLSGEQYAEEVVSMENPVLSAGTKAAVVYDAGGQSLFVFRNREEAFSLSLEGGADLLSARINDAGWLAVTAQQSGYKGSVTVYDSSYEKKPIQINLSSTFVVDAAVSPDCKTVAVVTIGQQDGVFRSQVLFYPIDQKEPSAQVSLGSLTVLDLCYQSGQLWVLGEDALVAVAADGSSTAQYSFGRSYLKGCSLSGDGFAVVLLGRYRAGAASQAVVVGPDGQAAALMDLRTPVLSLSAAGRYLSLLTGDGLTIYTPDLAAYQVLSDTDNARYCALSADGSALLADSQQAWLYVPS